MAGPQMGLNEAVFKQLMMNQRILNTKNTTPNNPTRRYQSNVGQEDLAESEYRAFKGKAAPIQKKLMWPSTIMNMVADPTYSKKVIQLAGKATGKSEGALGEILKPLLGQMGGLAYLGPKAISETMKSKRLAYEKRFAPQLGAVGSMSRVMDSLSTINYLMSGLPRGLSMLSGSQFGASLAKRIPRVENFLTGTAGARVLGKGAEGAAGGGIATSLYKGLTSGVDSLSGGLFSGLASKAGKGGIAGILGSGLAGANKGMTSLLSSPFGLSMGLAGLQVGAAIYKSVKLAKLQPSKTSPDKLGRKFYGQDAAGQMMQRISTMASTGKVDPQTLSFMVLQVIESDIRKSNILISGLRGELASESDFLRQEKEKGTDQFTGTYEKEAFGEDNRGMVSRALDALEKRLSIAKNKYDPFTQLTNFAFGLLRGKIIFPGQEVSKIAKSYGYTNEEEMAKDKAGQLGITMSSARLIHMTSTDVLRMGQTYEAKMLAILCWQADLQRLSVSELMTIRIGAFGLEKNITFRKEKGSFAQAIEDLGEKLNPLNIPGINAVWNITKGAFNFITKTLPSIPENIFRGTGKVIRKLRRGMFGEEYESLQSSKELRKAAGLDKDVVLQSQEFLAYGAPPLMESINRTLIKSLEVQIKMLTALGGEYGEAESNKRLMSVWDPFEGRYISIEHAEKLEQSRTLELEKVKEEAFRKGWLGQLLERWDSAKSPFSDFSETFERGVERMTDAEVLMGKVETAIFGRRETFPSIRVAQLVGKTPGVQTKVGLPETSREEIESERQFENVGMAQQKTKAGLTSLSMILGPLVGLATGGFASVLTGAGIGILGLGLFAKSRTKQLKEIGEAAKEQRKVSAKGRAGTTLEEMLPFQELPIEERVLIATGGVVDLTRGSKHPFGGGSVASRLGKSEFSKTGVLDIHDISTDSVEYWKLEYLEDLKFNIIDIKNYLGKDDHNNIYSLFAPKVPQIAEISLDDDTVNRLGKVLDFSKKQVSGKRAKGGSVLADSAYLVGEEKKAELFIPERTGTIIPMNIFEKLLDTSQQILFKLTGVDKNINIQTEIESLQEKERIRDIGTETLQEALQEVKEEKEKKLDRDWKSMVLKLLGKGSEGTSIIPKKEQKSGNFLLDLLKGGLGGLLGTISNFLGSAAGSILGGIVGNITSGLGSLGKLILGSSAIKGGTSLLGKLFGKTGGAADATKIVDEAAAASKLGKFGKVAGKVGKVAGKAAVPLMILTSAFDFVSDGIQGYKQSGGSILETIKSVLMGTVKPGAEALSGVSDQALKYSGIGMLAGLPFAPPIGPVVGGLLGGAIGAIIGMFRNNVSASELFDKAALWGPNAWIMEGLEALTPDKSTIGMTLARFGSIIPIIGPLAGWLIGTPIDGIIDIFKSVGQFGKFIYDLTGKANDYVVNKQTPNSYARSFADSKISRVVPILGPFLGSLAGSVIDMFAAIFPEKGWLGRLIDSLINISPEPVKSILVGLKNGASFVKEKVVTTATNVKEKASSVIDNFVNPLDYWFGGTSKKIEEKRAAVEKKYAGAHTQQQVQTPQQAQSIINPSAGFSMVPQSSGGEQTSSGEMPSSNSGSVNSSLIPTSNAELLTKMKNAIKNREGKSLVPYLDPPKNNIGLYSIGYGHGIRNDKHLMNGITEQQANQLFENDFINHAKVAARTPGYSQLNEARKFAILDMSYQMGDINTRKHLPGLGPLLQASKWKEAADYIRNSWYGQRYSSRAFANAQVLESGNVNDIKVGKLPKANTAGYGLTPSGADISGKVDSSGQGGSDLMSKLMNVFGVIKTEVGKIVNTGIDAVTETTSVKPAGGVQNPAAVTAGLNAAKQQMAMTPEARSAAKAKEEAITRQAARKEEKAQKVITQTQALNSKIETNTPKSVPVIKSQSTGTSTGDNTFEEIVKVSMSSVLGFLQSATVKHPFGSNVTYSV